MTDDSSPLSESTKRRLALLAGLAVLVLLFFPPVPPQAVVFLVLATVSIWLAVSVTLQLIRDLRFESFEEGAETGEDTEEMDPVDSLKRAYVEGEISESEFERKLETELGDAESDLERKLGMVLDESHTDRESGDGSHADREVDDAG